MNLIPIGTVRFRFNKRFRRDTEIQNVLIEEVNIMCETDRHIDDETYKALIKTMTKPNKTDLLTDGRDFYTTRGNVITQIYHGSFNGVLEMHRDEVNKLLYG